MPQTTAFILTLLLICCLTACRREQAIVLEVDFGYEVVDNDYSVPVYLSFSNKTSGALFYKWTFEGGNPETYDKKEPGIILFTKPGPIKVKLEAWNDNERKEKEIIIQLDTTLQIGFEVMPAVNNFAPVEWELNNTTIGATQFNWIFENGTPAIATGRNPASISYTVPGTYRIKLEAVNDRGEKGTLSKLITVLPSLSADFEIIPSFDDEDDYEAPLTATLLNRSISATQHQWSAPGGTLSSSTDSIPTVTFSIPGDYAITYEAGNGKQAQTVTRHITVKPNTGLRTFTDVKLGINTAHNTIGSFFSTKLRKVFKQGEVDASNGDQIDLVYFGLSASFSFNRFVRPDSAQHWTFAAIPGAANTAFVNSQELCGCGMGLNAAEFDNITNGSDLDIINIAVNAGGLTAFSNSTLPRVVLFQNAWGKKGAIRIKSYVQDGQQSYIICDIKVQKD